MIIAFVLIALLIWAAFDDNDYYNDEYMDGEDLDNLNHISDEGYN